MEQAFRPYREAWEDIRYDIEELIDAGDRVVSIVNNLGRGRASGAEVELRVPGVWTLRNGKIVRVVFFSTRKQALEAVGLREQAVSRENVEPGRVALSPSERSR